VRTVREECLNWLLIFSKRQLERTLHTYIDHYNRQRPHRTLALAAPDPLGRPTPLGEHSPTRVHRIDRLGGLLHEYQRAA
jgi:hypothetical protein